MAVLLSALELRSIVPGVRVVAVPSPTLPPATTTNCWLLGDRDVIAVDPAGVTERARAGLDHALDAGGLRVAAIFLTHHHGDHFGGAAHLRARTGAPIWAHPWTIAHVGVSVDRALAPDETLDTDDGRRWRLLHTPGHAPGHLCAFDGETVVAGDMVAGEGTIVLDPPEGDLAQYLDSLERLLALGAQRLLPAHGPVIEPAVPLLRHYIDHRHARTEQVRRALEATPGARPIDLVATIYADLPPLFHPVAARQVLCHLRWLQTRGAAWPQADRWTSTPP